MRISNSWLTAAFFLFALSVASPSGSNAGEVTPAPDSTANASEWAVWVASLEAAKKDLLENISGRSVEAQSKCGNALDPESGNACVLGFEAANAHDRASIAELDFMAATAKVYDPVVRGMMLSVMPVAEYEHAKGVTEKRIAKIKIISDFLIPKSTTMLLPQKEASLEQEER